MTLEDLFSSAQHREKNIEFRISKPNGEILWLSMIAIVVSNGKYKKSAIVLRLSDITVQRRVKQTLSSCESSLSFISHHCNEFIARFDEDLKCTFANPALTKHLGKSILNSRVVDLGAVLSPCDLWVDNLQATLKTGKQQTFRGCIAGEGGNPETHLLPLPSEDNIVRSVMSLTTRPR